MVFGSELGNRGLKTYTANTRIFMSCIDSSIKILKIYTNNVFDSTSSLNVDNKFIVKKSTFLLNKV